MEHWKDIPGSSHQISTRGRVRNAQTGRVLRVRRHTNGYSRIYLGASREEYVHRLVCFAFNGAPMLGQECDHINGCRADNRAENLRWISGQENKALRDFARGERNGSARLTATQVAEIRELLPEHSNTEIGRQFGVSRRTIADIRNGVTWK